MKKGGNSSSKLKSDTKKISPSKDSGKPSSGLAKKSSSRTTIKKTESSTTGGDKIIGKRQAEASPANKKVPAQAASGAKHKGKEAQKEKPAEKPDKSKKKGKFLI
jgi:hypothetical protein